MTFHDNYVDFHCHPSLKPFGKSFEFSPAGINRKKLNSKSSIWNYNPPTVMDKLLNHISGLTKFSQANFSAMVYGGVGVACVSLYPMEKWFVRNKIKKERILDTAANFALGIGKKRINEIQNINNYFKDLEAEYNFYKQLDGKIIKLSEGKFRYKIVNSYNEIELLQDQKNENGITTVCVIITIEGLHVLNTGLEKEPNENEVLLNLEKLKNWEHKPFFVTFAHHFWNHLCGHAESLSGIVKSKSDQSFRLDTGFTSLGKKVMKKLLDNKNGNRILVDVKHMSAKARNEYYQLLNSASFKDQHIPIIVSHGAANGLISSANRIMGRPSTARKLQAKDINLFDDEIVRIARNGGIIALQLDERRLASASTLKKTRKSLIRHKRMHYRSKLLWNQIQHIVEILDANNLFAWDCLAIGSDFDGIIDPLNGFWTAEEFPFLADYLERHAFNYTQSNNLKNSFNKIDTDEIVSRIMSSNGMEFFKKYF